MAEIVIVTQVILMINKRIKIVLTVMKDVLHV
jgi:hypothetical protein